MEYFLSQKFVYMYELRQLRPQLFESLEQFVTNLLAQGFFFNSQETTNMAQIAFYSNVDVAIIFFLPMNALVPMISYQGLNGDLLKSLGLSNGDYKKNCKISYFWCNFKNIVKILKNIAIVSKNKNKHTHNNTERKHKKSIPLKKVKQKNKIEHSKAPCI